METRASENDRLIGREPELSLLREFLGSDAPAPTLVLTGGQGIGKTALWEAGVRLARERATHVLAARPCEAEAQLSLAALFDWLEGIDLAALDELSAPQRRALEAALLRAEPAGDTPEPISIAVAFRGALRSLAASRPLLLAVDDLQWLDAASAAVLTFAARRLQGARVRFLLSRRSGHSDEVELALSPGGVNRIEVGPPERNQILHLS